jgi:hypothetical protein
MTRSTDQTPEADFLAPLAAEIARNRDLEALVFWESGGWAAEPAESLEPEEIVFYAEGLLDEGFFVEWQLVALADAPGRTDHIRLHIWEAGADAPPALPPGWALRDSRRWTPA